MLKDVLRCPSCNGQKLLVINEILKCEQCGSTYSITNEVIDFVAGRGTTKLDEIDYDSLYRISDEASPLVPEIIRCAGFRWPPSLGRVLEIGAGTGGQTLSLIKNARFDELAITDISPKMLLLCRERLVRTNLLGERPQLFATYGATDSPFSDSSFDTCFGSSVVHHIADVDRFLEDIVRTLKPDGVALFVEPNLRFHRALIATLSDIIAELLTDCASINEWDIIRMTNWIAEINVNITHVGDIEFLATREDKHMFLSEEIEATALKCGFDSAEALALGPDPTGQTTFRTYLAQCEVSQSMIEHVATRAEQISTRYFSLLHPRDLSPSYLLWFRKQASCLSTPPPRLTRSRPSCGAPIGCSLTDDHAVSEGHSYAGSSDPPEKLEASATSASLFRTGWTTYGKLTSSETKGAIRYYIELTMQSSSVHVQGWAVGFKQVAWLRVTIDGRETKLPVWLPSLDVHLALRANYKFSAVNSMCARLDGVVRLLATQKEEAIAIHLGLEAIDGGLLDITASHPVFLKTSLTLSG